MDQRPEPRPQLKSTPALRPKPEPQTTPRISLSTRLKQLWHHTKSTTIYMGKRAKVLSRHRARSRLLQERKKAAVVEAQAEAARIAAIPTPEQTKEAQLQMRVALSLYKKPNNTYGSIFQDIHAATKALDKARSLDSGAQLEVVDQKEKRVDSYTLDQLFAMVLHLEATTKFESSEKYRPAFPSNFGSRTDRKIHEIYDKVARECLAISDQAIVHWNDNPEMYRLKAKILKSLRRIDDARAVVRKAYELSPQSEETLQLMGYIG